MNWLWKYFAQIQMGKNWKFKEDFLIEKMLSKT